MRIFDIWHAPKCRPFVPSYGAKTLNQRRKMGIRNEKEITKNDFSPISAAKK